MKSPAGSVAWPVARIVARIAACLLPFVLSGCFHRSHPAPTQPLAPAIQNSQPSTPALEPSAPVVSEPAVIEPEKPAETPAASATTTLPASESPRPPVHHTPKKPANSHPQVASGGAAGVSAIGQLSSGDPGDSRRQTENSLASTEHGLKSITRPLNDQEQRTAAHIREFLKQARQALASGDVDGAHTLAAKARVLLNELNH